MNGDYRGEILLLAIVVSVGLHIGTMMFARPMVMTHGPNAAVARAARRPPMRFTRNHPTPPPVKIESVQDVDAVKDAPDATMPEPKALEDLAEEARAALKPDVPKTATLPPEPEDRILFDLKPVDLDRSGERPSLPMTPVETPHIKTAEMKAPVSAAPVAPVPLTGFTAPTIPAAGLDDSSLFAPSEAERQILLDKPTETEAPRREAFVPVKEVTERVDEKLVEREKEAVRELFDSKAVEELSSFVKVNLSASSTGGWTYFRIRFTPQRELPTIAKDVVVLLDASGSIGRDRIRSIRDSAKQILRGAMNTGDRFNLVAFRDKYEYCSRQWLPCDRRSYDFADAWLNNLAAHGRTDVFATIRSVLTLPRDPTRPLVALVVTDGDANSGVRKTAEIISKFTALNDGLISVYMYGVRENCNRELLDVLTRGNRGESFVYGGWMKWKAGSQIETLTERFRDPVLSDLRIVFAANSAADVYPRRLRNLYRGDTLEAVGRVPAGTKDVAFSIKGLNGRDPYESFFRLPLATAASDDEAETRWQEERRIDAKLGALR